MSKHMLSDTNTINDFNPYVMGDFSLPGASRQPHAFDSYPTAPVQMNTYHVDEESPLCSYGITAGDNTIDMCRPPAPNCPLSRPLLPGRNIDRGFTVSSPDEKKKVKGSTLAMNMLTGVFIIMILILLLSRR